MTLLRLDLPSTHANSTQTKVDPFAFTRGNRSGRVLFVGEAWGSEEARQRLPFVGQSGLELSKLLAEAGILETQVLFTNVVDSQPPGNDFSFFIADHKLKSAPTHHGIPLTPQLAAGIEKLRALIKVYNPELIIGAGNIPLWALTDCAKVSTVKGRKQPSGIMNWRGSQLYVQTSEKQIPFLPIVHPAAILRDWTLRPRTVHDLKSRASRFLHESLGWAEPHFHAVWKPKFAEALAFLNYWWTRAIDSDLWLSVDIETKCPWIACIGFADARHSLCIPFFHFDSNGRVVDYFKPHEEIQIVRAIKRLLTAPNVKIIGQNYNYDYQYLYRYWQIKTPVAFDTMLAHHLLYPGTPKSLEYLASLYCNHYVYWKDESQEWAGGDPETLWRYNCKDVRYTYDISLQLRNLVAHFNKDHLMLDQLEQWELAATMSTTGVLADKQARDVMLSELGQIADALDSFLTRCMPEDLRFAASGKPWYTSPTLTAQIFYDYLQIQPVLHKKTKKPTVDASSFDTLKKRAPWLTNLIDHLELMRSVAVFKSHFLDAKLNFADRICCSFGVGATDTFRWNSSSNSFNEGTNLQNIPKPKHT